jgi:hypothetical protein
MKKSIEMKVRKLCADGTGGVAAVAATHGERWVHLKLELRAADSQTLFGDGQKGSYLVPDAQF